MTFSLQVGLMFRRGARTLELVRELPDGKLALEDCATRRQTVYDKTALVKLVWAGHLSLLDHVDRNHRPETPSLSTLEHLSPRARGELERRMAYVTGLRKAHVSRGRRGEIGRVIATVAARISDPRPPSISTVAAWARRLDAAEGHAGALVDGNAVRRTGHRISADMERVVASSLQRVYLTRDRNSLIHTLAVVHAEAAKLVKAGKMRPDDAKISHATLCRRVAALDRHRVIEAREGAARARMVCRTTMDGAAAEYPLQRVEVDHTPLNWVVICDRTGLPLGRPLLTALVDAYSGYVLGFYVSFYGAGLTSVSGALRCAIKPKGDMTQGLGLENPWLAEGIPDQLMLDNGREFHSPVFQLIGWELGMDFTYCRVRTPWLKPHVERFFSTLDTITLAKGRIRKRQANVVEMDPNADAAVVFSDFVRGIVQFVVDVHPFQINQRKLARPFDLFAEGIERRPPVHFPPDIEALRRISGLSKVLTVGPGGVELHGLPFGGAELLDMRRQHGGAFKTLVKWDPDDLSHAWVQDPRTKEFVVSACRWPGYAQGLSWNQHLLIRKFARQEFGKKKAVEYLERARLRLHDHWMESVALKSRTDRKLAAITAGYTSARVLSGSDEPQATVHDTTPPRSTPPVVAPLCLEDFETVDLH